jgi:hypothetical protein
MKKATIVFLVLVLAMVLMAAGAAEADGTLDGSTEYDFMGLDGTFEDEGRLLIWEGTITGEINGTIRWYTYIQDMQYTGQASHYDLVWEIVDGDNVLMAGEDSGSTTARLGKNSNWRTNGIVTFANEDYLEWQGHHVHMGGNFTWAAPGLPDEGAGYFFVG